MGMGGYSIQTKEEVGDRWENMGIRKDIIPSQGEVGERWKDMRMNRDARENSMEKMWELSESISTQVRMIHAFFLKLITVTLQQKWLTVISKA